ncbi:peptidase S28 [Desarmillaria tabescens]|uniref:Peptidase S28 n=1 Tax=Armillaria tabescens TaxID=1929756 RepID=A0AA39JB45_ARMTA|nr:peptidase S28 [Desarmillaria tabescens]KAK0439522.1 peptidase S28 [Desarmillaria tabescens]
MAPRTISLILLLTAVGHVCGRVPKPPGIPMVDVESDFGSSRRTLNARALPPYNTTYYFDQLIDHNDPSKGTFQQRYWHTAEHYQEGGPIIFMNAGEVNAAPYYGYVTNSTINGVIAQKYGGAAIVLEHRFFGESNPYPNLNVDSFQYHTIAQSIEDNVYFARNVVLPQDNGGSVGPDKAPWIIIGGSYPGALVSWTMAAHPDVFWIGYSSSGVVQVQMYVSKFLFAQPPTDPHTISDFWQYYEPIRENMPKNCSADVEAVIAHVDEVFFGSNTTAQRELQELFGFSTDLEVAQALKMGFVGMAGYAAQYWQLEVRGNVTASENGWGLDNALKAWGTHFTASSSSEKTGIPLSREIPRPRELNARDDYPVDDAYRSWFWMICNEIGFSLDGPPIGQGEIVSRLNRDCVTTYPEAFSEYPIPNVSRTNTLYGGWSVNNTRLFFANGKRDTWREATVSAVNSTAVSTETQPIRISNGFHASDLVMRLAAPDPTIVAVQDAFIAYVESWLKDFVPS